nr:MAG TPA: hypothetical protein [Caudoviricetes sp.]
MVLITVLTESLISVLITCAYTRFLSLIFNFFLVSFNYCTILSLLVLRSDIVSCNVRFSFLLESNNDS